MFRFIKGWYYKKLFLRIYFSHLNHPNQQDLDRVLSITIRDFTSIKNGFEKKKVNEHQKN